MIYLDNAATTRPLKELAEIYARYADKLWLNPSALYAPAVDVQRELMRSAEALLNEFGSAEHECFFTGSGTEGANTVVLGGARKRKGMNFVAGGAEHPCVEESFKRLNEQGYEVKYVKPDCHGYISAGDVAAAVDENTALVSVMHVNNETGAKNDIAAMAAAVKAKCPKALFHSDGVQAFMREGLANTANIDYYTVSAHKLHAHKGVGAVFYKKNAPLKPYLLGGGQEGGLRSGTQNVLGILCFAEAVRRLSGGFDALGKLRQALVSRLDGMEGVSIISPREEGRYCRQIVNASFEGVNGETLLHSLEAEQVYISTGSACSSKKGKSRFAKMLGVHQSIADGAVRLSFSPFNTVEEVERACDAIEEKLKVLRKFKRV